MPAFELDDMKKETPEHFSLKASDLMVVGICFSHDHINLTIFLQPFIVATLVVIKPEAGSLQKDSAKPRPHLSEKRAASI